MLGYTTEEIAAQTLLDFVFPEDEPAARLHLDCQGWNKESLNTRRGRAGLACCVISRL